MATATDACLFWLKDRGVLCLTCCCVYPEASLRKCGSCGGPTSSGSFCPARSRYRRFTATAGRGFEFSEEQQQGAVPLPHDAKGEPTPDLRVFCAQGASASAAEDRHTIVTGVSDGDGAVRCSVCDARPADMTHVLSKVEFEAAVAREFDGAKGRTRRVAGCILNGEHVTESGATLQWGCVGCLQALDRSFTTVPHCTRQLEGHDRFVRVMCCGEPQGVRSCGTVIAVADTIETFALARQKELRQRELDERAAAARARAARANA